MICIARPSLLVLLEKEACYPKWKSFLADTISPILAVQNTAHVIIDAATASKMASAANQNFGLMFGSDRAGEGAGFFDEDEEDDDMYDESIPQQAARQQESDFADFDEFSATMATSKAVEDDGFSLKSFADPNLFTSAPAVAYLVPKQSSAFSSTVSKDLGKG